MKFTKVHGLGNDFILVEAFDGLPTASPGELARQICHRHWGVGADGLVFLRPSQVADLRMQIFNADGSEAEMCGNALRGVARYAYERGYYRWDQAVIETKAGLRQVSLHLEDGRVKLVTADMGRPALEPERVPMRTERNPPLLVPLKVGERTYRVTGVSMGNPHAVVFVPDLTRVDLATEGSSLQHHPAFPEGANVEFVQVESPQRVRVLVWERGVGRTLACGTGACAVGVACVLNGLTDETLTVALPGGELEISWPNQGRIFMKGPAAIVFSGEWPD